MGTITPLICSEPAAFWPDPESLESGCRDVEMAVCPPHHIVFNPDVFDQRGARWRQALRAAAVTRVAWGHPAVLARYEQQLAHLQDALSKDINAGDSDAAEAIRELVETVTVFRDPSRPEGATVEIAGRLNSLLEEQAYPNKVRGVWGRWQRESATPHYLPQKRCFLIDGEQPNLARAKSRTLAMSI
jgi:hypothetical protein